MISLGCLVDPYGLFLLLWFPSVHYSYQIPLFSEWWLDSRGFSSMLGLSSSLSLPYCCTFSYVLVTLPVRFLCCLILNAFSLLLRLVELCACCNEAPVLGRSSIPGSWGCDQISALCPSLVIVLNYLSLFLALQFFSLFFSLLPWVFYILLKFSL